ncbi:MULTISPECIES: MarR family winged helix-turn-helix transcriptional regulator [Streptomyces]|jgi:DNA-binding MarR family transcriptional regulator|uniref:MarR family winged helix-turn-helix transcriptional regulator n=1 Tax=Streptomyces TaxID=1883 RepID=UPI000746BCFF|nr:MULTISPECIES: MarR family transcriptional regulator [Streptomyces]KUL72232.1 MarR family transcriptional regulator [Streptomyces sp. NRRL WC-3605]KUL78995.1 MarR family transcriptional regulator [Streptomyces sp. NRRL WC-3604]
MAETAQYEELVRQFSAFGAVKREMGRTLPSDCPSGSAAVLTLLVRHGEMRMSKLAELLAVDMSVTSRHVAHVAERGWIERSPDPADKRSRIVRLTPSGEERVREMSHRTTRLLEERLSDWSDDDIASLIRLMARLRASFDDCRTPAITQ